MKWWMYEYSILFIHPVLHNGYVVEIRPMRSLFRRVFVHMVEFSQERLYCPCAQKQNKKEELIRGDVIGGKGRIMRPQRFPHTHFLFSSNSIFLHPRYEHETGIFEVVKSCSQAPDLVNRQVCRSFNVRFWKRYLAFPRGPPWSASVTSFEPANICAHHCSFYPRFIAWFGHYPQNAVDISCFRCPVITTDLGCYHVFVQIVKCPTRPSPAWLSGLSIVQFGLFLASLLWSSTVQVRLSVPLLSRSSVVHIGLFPVWAS